MANQHFTTLAYLDKPKRQTCFSSVVTFGPQETSQQVHIRVASTPITVMGWVLIGFVLGHVLRRGRKWAWRSYQHVIATQAAQMVAATTKRRGE